MTLLDTAHIAVFLFGVSVTIYAIATAVRHARWMKRNDLSLVLFACWADDVIDNIATLIFSANTVGYVIHSDASGGAVFAIHPWLGVGLRFAIFGAGALLMGAVSSKARSAAVQNQAIAAEARDVLADT